MAAGGLTAALRGFAVLMYHGVSREGEEPAVPRGERRYWVVAAQLRAQLAQVRGVGYRAAPLRAAWGSAGSLAGPWRPVVLTFDDGQAADYEVSFPLLLEAGVTAEFFVNTATVGTAGHLTWAQIAEMHRAGMSFQSHAHDHVNLARLPVRALEQQLRRSKTELEDRLGVAAEFLAAPYGLLSPQVLAAAQQQGYAAVCTSRAWPARPGAPTIGRTVIYRSTPLRDVLQIVACRPTPYLARAIRAGLIYVPKQVLLSCRPRRLDVQLMNGSA